jgi:hypothetical protein
MKCPKCNYTGFDYLDNCQRCGNDLRDVRTVLQIIAVSPEDRTPRPPPASVHSAVGGVSEASSAAEPAKPTTELDGETGEDLFEGLDFDESFEDLVEQTSYETPSAEPVKPAAEDEELLDLDFGDLFGEETEKKE